MQNLGASDIIHQYIMRTQKMSLHGKKPIACKPNPCTVIHSQSQTKFFIKYAVYQPAIVISIHGVIAQVEKPNIEWPKSFQR